MLAMTREQLVEHLQELSGIVDGYVSSSNYVEYVLKWLESVERSLQRVRNPMSSLVASERTKLLAAMDGMRSKELGDQRMSPRKALRATTALVIERVETALRSKVAEIDERFDTYRDKMAQLLAVGTARQPIPLPPSSPREAWLQDIWSGLGVHSETQGMFGYLTASLTHYDRLHLLDDVIQNLLSVAGVQGSTSGGDAEGGSDPTDDAPPSSSFPGTPPGLLNRPIGIDISLEKAMRSKLSNEQEAKDTKNSNPTRESDSPQKKRRRPSSSTTIDSSSDATVTSESKSAVTSEGRTKLQAFFSRKSSN